MGKPKTVDEFLAESVDRYLKQPMRKKKHYLYVEITDEGLMRLVNDIKDSKKK